jgi:hypothetical protein
VQYVREECLDQPSAPRLTEYMTITTRDGLSWYSPLGLDSVSTEAPIRYRNGLGGIIRDYYRVAS